MVFKFFKMPTCGPCRMFQPQIDKAAAELGFAVEIYDLEEPAGLAEAKKYAIDHSGSLLLVDDSGEVKLSWPRPCPCTQIVKACGELK